MSLYLLKLTLDFTLHVTFTHTYTDGRGYHAGCQPAYQIEINIHTKSYTIGTTIGSNSGLSILTKSTSCGLEEPGIKLPIFRWVDNHSTSIAMNKPWNAVKTS